MSPAQVGPAPSSTAQQDRLPPLARGRRRGLLVRLVGQGVAQAALAIQVVVVVPLVLDPATSGTVRWGALASLAAGALVLGQVRARERVLAEDLGQDYAQELRTGLTRGVLAGRGPSLGVAVVRSSNDLTAVRNWVSLGIAPLLVAVPLVLGVLGSLWWLDPLLALGVAVPVLGLAAWVARWTPVAYTRSRELRRRRGRLAAQLADTVAAATTVRAAGGADREERRLVERGEAVRAAAVDRAVASGELRGGAAAAGALATVGVLAAAVAAGLPAGTVATGLTVVGVLVGPLTDLGRVAEYRAAFRAAARILAPALAAAHAVPAPAGSRPADGDGLCATGLVVGDAAVPDLDVPPGAVVVLRGEPARRRAVLDALAGTAPAASGHVAVGGRTLLDATARERRALVGVAAAGWPLERGTLERAVRYRRPDHDGDVADLLADVGLDDLAASLPRGVRTELRAGGAPLDRAQRARVHLARAVLGDPPLLVLDRLDDDLGLEGVPVLRRHLRRRSDRGRGVTVLETDQPRRVVDDWVEWQV